MILGKRSKYLLKKIVILLGLLHLSLVYADTTLTLGGVASTITGSFEQLTKLITAGSYLAGLAFSIGAIMKFKQHKDNPTQIPIGTPIALVFIAAALLFLPSVLGVSGETIFGSGAKTAGPSGTVFTTS
ncbi:MAG: type IV secretion protein IcmD [Legionellaceae bacterium]|nr:type IV secretion protein IcmD [Legionellaceae bacterium]HAF87133.1 type IV secretion protein IcmD [Legionellales bacterium]HCA89310.1 type IV secretion protein IcmD [Legionellales bacterium]|tara:strand:- start:1115 stop:1501 length:387 start_codon:yes stop_codon:yes gene_type:complete